MADGGAEGLDQAAVLQRSYYASTAAHYDAMHVRAGDEHFFALHLLDAVIRLHDFRSLLDVGAGTGRAAQFLQPRHPHLRILSVEPVAELREVGHAAGLGRDQLVDGDATRLPFGDGEFDLACEFGALHHIRDPRKAVREMLRVGRRGIFISDHNNFGSGSRLARTLKQAINAVGLWKVADFVKTRGRGYTISEGDGLAYSYSVFNDLPEIQRTCDVYVLNTTPGGANPYRTASHIALLGLKRR